MHRYTKRRYKGCALTMRRFQCTQSSIAHTIVKHDNIGNYIAMVIQQLHDCERCVYIYLLILKKT